MFETSTSLNCLRQILYGFYTDNYKKDLVVYLVFFFGSYTLHYINIIFQIK